MKLKAYRDFFTDKLAPLYDREEANQFFVIALQHLKGWSRTDIALNPDAELTKNEFEQWNAVLADLEQQKPIQYIFGKAYFYGLEFTVTENTLIPRPETEELVEWIIEENADKGKIKLLDIGTGSGCIAIALAHNLKNAEVHAIDVSAGAIKVAKQNAIDNGVNVTFIEMDILPTPSLSEEYDVIVSNPPYVRNLEKQEIKKNVLDYEPHTALFVDDNNPLLFYDKIAALAKESLKPDGKLYFEINQYLGSETVTMLEEQDYKNIILKKDLSGNDRMIKAEL
ncbi:release factor glutamine methyltransferase [Flavobacterium suaedae]|uniref:Release factor glutamine methyltransferase n=1 Tax=Flavobacterium suaedae TaxID=1767027 RepID=A0ABQ1JQI6_9FLAO|nr:peptide chain release factor N(5)-glutamine methyltransferase [Flavobacterium suaedae]GGB74747.1 release factor glutamine methyltransferase [Flavobacterium suaedae]